jgi:membrane-associated phospholipid phosphatase
MRIAVSAIGLGLLTLTRVAPAQSVGNMLKDDIRFAARDVGAVWTAPFDARGRDWLLAAGAFGAFGLAMLADQEASDWAIRQDSTALFNAIKPLRRGGFLYSGKYLVPPVAAMYVIGIVAKNQDMRDFVTGCASSWLAQGAVRKGTAYLIGRARPDTMPDNPNHWQLGNGYDNWMMRSFPAGHFANALGCVTFANTRYEMGVIEPVLYAVAAGVGVGRMTDKGHWLSDTVIGGILGYAVGREVGVRSRARDEARQNAGVPAGSAGAAPQFGIAPSTNGMTLSLSWTF